MGNVTVVHTVDYFCASGGVVTSRALAPFTSTTTLGHRCDRFPYLTHGKSRHGEVRLLTPGHTTSKWPSCCFKAW